jgi:hypothetical protein
MLFFLGFAAGYRKLRICDDGESVAKAGKDQRKKFLSSSNRVFG